MNLNFAACDTFPEHWSLKKTFENKDPRVHPLLSERKAYRTLYTEFMSGDNRRLLTRVLERSTKQKFGTDSTIFDQEMLRIYMEKAWSESASVADLIHKRRQQLVLPSSSASTARQNKRRSLLSSFLYGVGSADDDLIANKQQRAHAPSLLKELNKAVVSHFNRKLKKYKKAGLSYYVDHVEKSSNNLSPPERPSLATATRNVGTGDSFSLAELSRMSSKANNANNANRGIEADTADDTNNAYDRMKYVTQMSGHPLASEVSMSQVKYADYLQNVREHPEKYMSGRSAVYR